MSTAAKVTEITNVSKKKIEANRRNAKLSTGPRTEAGKNRSRYNAIKHGIFSSEMLQSEGLGTEDVRAFDDLLTMLLEDREPVDILEEVMVERTAVCLWRLKRALQYEAGTMKLRYMDAEAGLKSQGSDEASYFEFVTPVFRHLRLPQAHDMDLLLRYETTFHRQLVSTLNQLERLQRTRKGEHVPAPVAVQVMTDQ